MAGRFEFDNRTFPYILKRINGTWRSLVARTLGVREVAGSNPVVPTNINYLRAAIKWRLVFYFGKFMAERSDRGITRGLQQSRAKFGVQSCSHRKILLLPPAKKPRDDLTRSP